MSWPDRVPLVLVLLAYLAFLFLIAAVAERFGRRLQAPRLRTVTYVLAVSVYCTAWTFYGSVGLAANRGLEFLTIYLGPAMMALLWPTVLRKLVRVVKEQRITTISDFIASRYGKSAPLGTLVAVLVVCGMIPYIALQLKAVSVSLRMMIGEAALADFDPTLLIAVTLAIFGILFGARNLDFTRQQTGLIAAVAVESVVKLVAFLVVGAYVTWGLFGGFGDIFARIAAEPRWSALLTLDAAPSASYARWTAMLVISMMAVILLPRQFHVLVVQNPRERDVQTAAWAFPLYLLAINLFVLPIAFGGLLRLGGAPDTADSFILALPLAGGAPLVAVAVFIGGFSAATAMIVVDSLALSKMISNDIVLPFILRRGRFDGVYWASLNSTRLGILVVVMLGYVWAKLEAGQVLLVEMGLLSFIAVTQCAPAVLFGLYWRRGTRRGAFWSISLGFALWFYTLILPALVREGFLGGGSLLSDGPLGLTWLSPVSLFGLRGLDPLTHGVFWSLFVNVGAYLFVSMLSTPDADERSQAAAFVGGRVVEPSPTPAVLSVSELERLIHLYVPEQEADAILHGLLEGKTARELTLPELLDLRIRLERLLAASLGAAAARFIVEDRFTISKGEAQALVDSFQAMQRSLRHSERLLASVVESVEDCIFTTDVDGHLITLNPAGQRLLGHTGADAPRLSYLDVLGETDRRRVGPAIQQALAGGGAWRGSVSAVARDGGAFPAHLAITSVFDARRQIIGGVGVLRDLTEQLATQQRLIQREKLASLGEMAAGVAHEIRNPLGGIKMATRLLDSGVVGDGRIPHEMAQSIVAGIVEIERIVADLLEYARDTRLDLQAYPLARILAPVVEAAGAGEEGGHRRVLVHGLDEGVTVTVDGPRLRQVFANVLKNALEATERTPEPRVDVALSLRGAAAVITVADNGAGLTPEAREKLFLPFFTTKPTGTGLGMAIVRKIMDLHGGEIEIESQPGRGTTVRLIIPGVAPAPTTDEVSHEASHSHR
jgi:PAS domain S-box-containing protein